MGKKGKKKKVLLAGEGAEAVRVAVRVRPYIHDYEKARIFIAAIMRRVIHLTPPPCRRSPGRGHHMYHQDGQGAAEDDRAASRHDGARRKLPQRHDHCWPPPPNFCNNDRRVTR